MSKDVIWSKTTAFYSRANNDISANVSGNDWIAFLDAMGWMENSGKYGGISDKGFAGMYQCDEKNLGYYHFLNGVGKQFLGVTTKRQFADNPIAQDLAAIMEFSGMPKVTIIDPPSTPFSSVYLAVRSNARDIYKLSTAIFDQLIGKTITIIFTGEGSETITLTEAGISSAAHLVGAGKMAEVMYKIYKQSFSEPDQYGKITQTSSTATFPREGFADGNNVAFSTYARLLEGYNISSLLNANNLADFNALARELMAQRKDKIINYLVSKKQETAMSVSYNTNDYRETVRAILVGLDLSTEDLDAVEGQVVLVGAVTTKYTDKADLIFGLGTVDNALNGGKGNDTLYGGAGNDWLFGGEGNDTMYGGADDDTYCINPDGGVDRIEDKEGNNRIIFCGELIDFFYYDGTAYKSLDGWETAVMSAGQYSTERLE